MSLMINTNVDAMNAHRNLLGTENMLSKFRSADEVRSSWSASGFSNQLADWRYASQHAGLVRALGILLAEMFAIELPDVTPGGEVNHQLLERWLSGLPWRSKPTPKSPLMMP